MCVSHIHYGFEQAVEEEHSMKKPPTGDPAHDVLKYDRQPLDVIFRPETVAVIGATDKAVSVGRTVMRNLFSNPFGGTVFPVNPNRSNVLGIKAYPSVLEVPEQVDLAVIVSPAPTVPSSSGRSWKRHGAAGCASSDPTASG